MQSEKPKHKKENRRQNEQNKQRKNENGSVIDDGFEKMNLSFCCLVKCLSKVQIWPFSICPAAASSDCEMSPTLLVWSAFLATATRETKMKKK